MKNSNDEWGKAKTSNFILLLDKRIHVRMCITKDTRKLSERSCSPQFTKAGVALTQVTFSMRNAFIKLNERFPVRRKANQ